MTNPGSLDPIALRNALGSFATGVAVVTSLGLRGEDVGITVNSFSSVSLDPPLVLWSIDKDAQSYESFIQAEFFCIHILTESQQTLSNRFAGATIDKFKDIVVNRDEKGIPLLDACAARFHCRTEFQYEGGDHMIIVGAVQGFESWDLPPLLFHGGRYRTFS